MSGDDALQRIDIVDAFTRALYIRTTESNSPLVSSIASSLRQLHVSIRHLRIEAADPDSLLNANNEDAALYSRQLKPLVDDSEFAVKQLDAVIDKHKDTQELHGADGFRGGLEDEALRARIAAIKSKLVTGKIEIDMFLDTVQLQGDKIRNKTSMEVLALQEGDLEKIKDKLDAVAQKVFQKRQAMSGYDEDEDDGWSDFKSELEGAGFSPQVLQKHKEVLRAYVREMESRCLAEGGPPPTVRGLLEYEAAASPTTPRAVQHPSDDRDIYFTHQDIKDEQKYRNHLHPTSPRQSFHFLSHEAPKALSDDLSFDRPCSDISDDNSSNPSLAMISTKDLMAMDSINTSMNNVHLKPLPQHNYQCGSPRGSQASITYPPPPGALMAPYKESEYTSSADPERLGSSPRYMPPVPGAGLGTSPTRPDQAPPVPSARPTQKLAPDRWGNEIPMDAQWTRVRRSLISPEVLSRAGVRYEARPDYVAILGRLSKGEIADLARQSADARAARTLRSQKDAQYLYTGSYQTPTQIHPSPPAPQPSSSYPPRSEQPCRPGFANDRRPPPPTMNGGRARSGSKSSHTDNDDSSVLWDESDTTDYDDDKTSFRNGKGHRSYRYIVDPPSKDKGTPSATVMPKPILKNKNAENHVRFDALPHGRSPSSRYDDRDGGRRARDGSSENPRSSRYKSPNDGGRRRRDKDDDYSRSSHYRDGHRDRDGRGNRDRLDERSRKKKAWGETLGAVGIGGAAVSLLGVLAEAASGM